jgi:type I restriction-modification system DNA methylase subunit
MFISKIFRPKSQSLHQNGNGKTLDKAIQIKKQATNQGLVAFKFDFFRPTGELFQSHARNKKHRRKVGQTLHLR